MSQFSVFVVYLFYFVSVQVVQFFIQIYSCFFHNIHNTSILDTVSFKVCVSVAFVLCLGVCVFFCLYMHRVGNNYLEV